jgi:hypothetical protein
LWKVAESLWEVIRSRVVDIGKAFYIVPLSRLASPAMHQTLMTRNVSRSHGIGRRQCKEWILALYLYETGHCNKHCSRENFKINPAQTTTTRLHPPSHHHPNLIPRLHPHSYVRAGRQTHQVSSLSTATAPSSAPVMPTCSRPATLSAMLAAFTTTTRSATTTTSASSTPSSLAAQPS